MKRGVNITDRFFRSASAEPDAIPEPYLGVGYELQQTRKARGLAIARVASELRIQESFLAALEEGRFDDLPGPAYAAGFLRSYADFLAVDRTQVMELYRSETGAAAAKPDLRFPQPLKASSRPSKWLLVLLAVVIFAGYGIWSEAPAGAIAKTARAASAINPAFKSEWFLSKPISFVGLRG